MEADEGSNGSDSVRGSQFRRRRSEPVHRRPRTLSQNNNFYGSGRASDTHMLQGEPRRPGTWEDRRGGAGEFQNGDGRGSHRQTKLIGRDEDNAGRYDASNGRYRQDNGYHEHRQRGPEKRESGDGEVKSGREGGSRVEAGSLLKKWNKVDRNLTAAEAAVTHRSMNGVADRDHGRGAAVGSRTPGFAKDRNEGDFRTDLGSRGNGDEAGGSQSKSPSSVRPGVTKLKLKVGSVTHTLHSISPSAKPMERDPEPPGKRRRHRLILEQNSDDEDEEAGLAGVQPVQDATFDRNTSGSERTTDREVPQLMANPLESAGSDSPVPSLRKSSRVPKKRVLDGDEDDDHDSTRKGARKSDNGRPEDEDDGANDESTSDRGTENTDEDDEDVLKTKKGRIQDIYDSTLKEKERSAPPLTARQRAMQEKDNDQVASLIEFPDGLRDTQHRRKAKLSDADRQVKRAEAARKRKQQVEKNAKDIQASAIQKILGQDSSRKKREEKLSKQRAEIEEEKKAAALEPASNKIRWTVGPSGITVSWSRDVELPVFFSSQPRSYPPPREKCAGPACENAYIYRDSKSEQPLCSLQCYKRIQGLTGTVAHRPNHFDLVEAQLSAFPPFRN